MNVAKQKTRSSVSKKTSREDEEKKNEERVKNIRKAFKLPQNSQLKEWLIEQIVQWRMVDKKKDKTPETKEAVFQELLAMFQFLDTETKEKTEEEKQKNSYE